MATRKKEESTERNALVIRKVNDVVGIRIRKGRLTFLIRKVFNVMLGHAQQLKVPGQNAPSGVDGGHKMFWAPLASLCADANFDSNDTKVLQESLMAIQDIGIIIEDAKHWRSENLVASVVLAHPLGRGVGKPIWVGWEFPAGVHELAVRPSEYTHLSLYYQGLFRTGAALALYEFCREFATSPGRRTPERDIVWWFHHLSGRPVSAKPPEYKYWKRDDLKPAIAEVNANSDIEIEPVEKRAARRVISLHFKIKEKTQARLDLAPPPLIDTSLLAPLMALGIGQKDAEEVLRTYDAIQINSAIEAMKARLKSTRLPQITSRRAYLRSILKNGIPEKEPEGKQEQPRLAMEDASAALRDDFEADRRREAKAMLQEMDDEGRAAVFNEFLETTASSMRASLRRSGPLSPVASSFHTWFANKTWGAATDSDLLQFAAQRLAQIGMKGADNET